MARLFVEIVTVAAAATLGLATMRSRDRDAGWMAPAALASFFHYVLAAAVLCGFTWRLLPAGLSLGALSLYHVFPADRRGRGAKAVGILSLAAGFLSLGAVMAFPARDLDKPSGRFAVGTASFMVVDEARKGVYLDGPGVPRRFMVQAWYPAVSPRPDVEPEPWIADEAVPVALADYAGLPAFLLGHLGTVRSNSYRGLRYAGGAGLAPVVVMSHGWSGSRFLHADLAEELASRGIVVLGIDHPYGGQSVTLVDGTVLPHDPTALPERDQDTRFLQKARALVGTYAADIETLLRYLRSGSDPLPVLSGRLDLSRVALAGHSTGGGAAVLAALRSGGVVGVLGLDAWVEPLGLEAADGLGIPQLHVGSAQWDGGINERTLAPFLAASKAAGAPVDAFRVRRSMHGDFTMIGGITALGSLVGMAGSVGSREFFDVAYGLSADWLEALLTQGPAAAAWPVKARDTEPLLYRDPE